MDNVDIWKVISLNIFKIFYKQQSNMLSFNYLSRMCKFKNIVRNSDLPWDWKSMSTRTDLNWEFVKDNLDKDWDWNKWLSSKTILFELVKDNLDKDWDWGSLSYNSNIPWEFIRERILNNIDQYQRTISNEFILILIGIGMQLHIDLTNGLILKII